VTADSLSRLSLVWRGDHAQRSVSEQRTLAGHCCTLQHDACLSSASSGYAVLIPEPSVVASSPSPASLSILWSHIKSTFALQSSPPAVQHSNSRLRSTQPPSSRSSKNISLPKAGPTRNIITWLLRLISTPQPITANLPSRPVRSLLLLITASVPPLFPFVSAHTQAVRDVCKLPANTPTVCHSFRLGVSVVLCRSPN
jgi:hypothetical protein